MKKIFIPTICLILISSACKKDRTCSCTTNSTDNYSVTYNNSSFSNTSGTSSSTSTSKTTVEKIKKRNVRQLLNCNSRTEKYKNTNTNTVTGTITATYVDDYTDEITCTLD